jgi:hypothetical protein
MAYKKADLLHFIEQRINKNLKEVRGQIDDIIETKTDEFCDENVDFSKLDMISTRVKKLSSDLQDTLNQYHGVEASNYGIKQVIEKLNYNCVQDLIDSVRTNYRNIIYRSVNNNEINAEYSGRLMDYCRDAIIETRSLYKKIDSINNLSKQLRYIVKAQPSGDKAYKKLLEVGMDMTEFVQEASAGLPAVAVITEDISLFNRKDGE